MTKLCYLKHFSIYYHTEHVRGLLPLTNYANYFTLLVMFTFAFTFATTILQELQL